MERSPSTSTVITIGVIGTVAVVAAALAVGATGISPLDTARVIVDRLLPIELATPDVADAIIWNIRLPRVLSALGAGAALGIGGVVLQGLFRNPVADPQLVGLSAIASIGVLIGAWIGWTALGPIAAVVGGAIAGAAGAGVVRVLARNSEGDGSRFILAGIGFGVAIAGVVAAGAVALNDPRIPDVPFWFVGGLGGSTWGTAGWVLGIAVVATAIVMPFGDRIDIMSLGTASASHLGVDVARVTAVGLAAIGLGVGAAVGAAGVVAFVGLLAGSRARAIVGAHHRVAIVAAFFLGAWFLIGADALGRLVGGRFEIPVGLVTAALGGPYLVWMIATRRST